MTTDNFTEAARAEAERRNPSSAPNGLTRASNAISRRDFRDGAEWARTHLAQQEPTDAEVLAAALAICRLQDDGYEPTEDHPCGACTESARAALLAARAARRDEE